MRSLPPPVAPALWHSPHDLPLKIGPRPSSGVSISSNAVRPAWNFASESSGVARSGPPIVSPLLTWTQNIPPRSTAARMVVFISAFHYMLGLAFLGLMG